MAHFPSRGRQTMEVMDAARCGQAAEVEEAIHLGADVAARDMQGMTSLHHAASRGSLSIVEVLLRYKAPLDCLDDAGMAPLHSAVIHDRANVAQVSSTAFAFPPALSCWLRTCFLG